MVALVAQSKAHLATLLREMGEADQAKALYDEVMNDMAERLGASSDCANLSALSPSLSPSLPPSLSLL